jgi:hypothetical protein
MWQETDKKMVLKPEIKRSLGTSGCKWEYNIKMDFKCGVWLMHLTQGQW